MSSSIWTLCAGDSEIRPLRLEPWRAVESQHQVATRRLVDTDAEQRVLEGMIDGAKPPDPTHGRRHYLLATPFRYPPLRHGSRFGHRTERGIWYGAETLRTVFAEVAYYRLVFLAGTTADLGPLASELTTFRARVRTERGLDLTVPPFAAHESILASPASYAATQELGTALRAAGVQAIRYRSARDPGGAHPNRPGTSGTPAPLAPPAIPDHSTVPGTAGTAGTAVAVFDPAAFGYRLPRDFGSWHCVASAQRVEITSRSWFGREVHAFERTAFLVDGQLPTPAF